MSDDTQSFSADKKDRFLTPQILVLGEVPASISLWQELLNSSGVESWLFGNTAMDLLSSWAHLQRFVLSSLDKKLWQELNELVREDAAKLIDSVAQLRPLSDFSQRAETLNLAWDGVADNDEAEPITNAISELFYILDNTSLALVACDKLRNFSQSAHLQALAAFRKDVETAEEYFEENAEQFLCVARWASWMLEAYRPDLDEDTLLWETTLKCGRLKETFELLNTAPSCATPLPIKEMAKWLKGEQIATAVRLLSRLHVSPAEPDKAKEADGEVSVEAMASLSDGGKALTVSIRCATAGPRQPDWRGVPVCLTDGVNRYFCTLEENGTASLDNLPVNEYHIESWVTAVRIDDPIFQANLPRQHSKDRRLQARILEDMVTVEVSTNERALANNKVGGVLVNADSAKEVKVLDEIALTYQQGSWRGKMQLADTGRSKAREFALVGAPRVQFEWLLVYLK